MKVCSKCSLEQPIKQYSKDRRNNSGLASWCKSCHLENKKTWRQTSKGIASERNSHLKRYYDMSSIDYDIMYANQQGCCAICKTYYPVLDVDHKHSTNKVRALLCSNCNHGIGCLKESVVVLSEAINYIQTYNT